MLHEKSHLWYLIAWYSGIVASLLCSLILQIKSVVLFASVWLHCCWWVEPPLLYQYCTKSIFEWCFPLYPIIWQIYWGFLYSIFYIILQFHVYVKKETWLENQEHAFSKLVSYKYFKKKTFSVITLKASNLASADMDVVDWPRCIHN